MPRFEIHPDHPEALCVRDGQGQPQFVTARHVLAEMSRLEEQVSFWKQAYRSVQGHLTAALRRIRS